ALCLYPGADVEMLEAFGRELTERTSDPQQLSTLLDEMLTRNSNVLQVSDAQYWVGENPEAELRLLAKDFVEPPSIEGEEEEKPRKVVGRNWIRSEMRNVFQNAGLLGLVQENLPVVKYTNEDDDFTFDFAYNLDDRE